MSSDGSEDGMDYADMKNHKLHYEQEAQRLVSDYIASEWAPMIQNHVPYLDAQGHLVPAKEPLAGSSVKNRSVTTTGGHPATELQRSHMGISWRIDHKQG